MNFRELQPETDLDHCEAMGFDCAENGANERNCHFTIFGTTDGTKAWETGKRKAEMEDEHP